MRDAVALFVGVMFLSAVAVLHAEESAEKSEKAEKPKKAEKAEKEESAEATETTESAKPEAKAPCESPAKAAVVLPPTRKGKYYFEGNTRKMHVGAIPRQKTFEPAAQTGAAPTFVPGVLDAARRSADTPGKRYHSCEGGISDGRTRTLPVSGGMRRMEPGVMLPAQSFTVASGIGIVPYAPLSGAGLRAVTTPRKPYYGGNKGKYEFRE